MVPIIGGVLAAVAGLALTVWGAAVSRAMRRDATFARAGGMPEGASHNVS